MFFIIGVVISPIPLNIDSRLQNGMKKINDVTYKLLYDSKKETWSDIKLPEYNQPELNEYFLETKAQNILNYKYDKRKNNSQHNKRLYLKPLVDEILFMT